MGDQSKKKDRGLKLPLVTDRNSIGRKFERKLLPHDINSVPVITRPSNVEIRHFRRGMSDYMNSKNSSDTDLLGLLSRQLKKANVQLKEMERSMALKDKKIIQLEDKLNAYSECMNRYVNLEKKLGLVTRKYKAVKKTLNLHNLTKENIDACSSSSLSSEDLNPSTDRKLKEHQRNKRKNNSLDDVDYDMIIEAIQCMNYETECQNKNIITNGKFATMKELSYVPMNIYKNGFQIGDSSFEYYHDEHTKAIINDLENRRCPDILIPYIIAGTTLKVEDLRENEFHEEKTFFPFSGKGQYLGKVKEHIPLSKISSAGSADYAEQNNNWRAGRHVSKREFLNKLSKTYVINGRLVDLRRGVADILEGHEEGPQCTYRDYAGNESLSVVSIRVFSPDSSRKIVMSVPTSWTIGDIRKEIDKLLIIKRGYVIYRAFPTIKLTNEHTPITADLVPNGVIYLHSLNFY